MMKWVLLAGAAVLAVYYVTQKSVAASAVRTSNVASDFWSSLGRFLGNGLGGYVSSSGGMTPINGGMYQTGYRMPSSVPMTSGGGGLVPTYHEPVEAVVFTQYGTAGVEYSPEMNSPDYTGPLPEGV
jgi:hypothetical protein